MITRAGVRPPVATAPDHGDRLSRRRFLRYSAALGLIPAFAQPPARAAPLPVLRSIPSSGERLPAIGMGSWITFHVGNDPAARAERVRILGEFFNRGGALVDSSPMYGRSEEVIGYCLRRLDNTGALFAATKVWIVGRQFGINQMQNSESYWGVSPLGLMQIHNMLDWQTHLNTLQQWRERGRIRYIGITTSHGRRHDEMAEVIRSQAFDFVQFTYNLAARQAEDRLLPLAADHGKAVIINRPFDGGSLFDRVRGRQLPPWSHEIGCANWAEFFLKFVISHPAVSCAIPATSQLLHMRENMGALVGELPDARDRRRMAAYFDSL